MGEQRNLTEENVDELRKRLERMQKTNPDLEYRFFEQDEIEDVMPSNQDILDELEDIKRKLDLIFDIFDGHILIDGSFRKTNIFKS